MHLETNHLHNHNIITDELIGYCKEMKECKDQRIDSANPNQSPWKSIWFGHSLGFVETLFLEVADIKKLHPTTVKF